MLRLPHQQLPCESFSSHGNHNRLFRLNFFQDRLWDLSTLFASPHGANGSARCFGLYPVVQRLNRNLQGLRHRRDCFASSDQPNSLLLEPKRVLSPQRAIHAKTLQSRSYAISLGRRSSGARSILRNISFLPRQVISSRPPILPEARALSGSHPLAAAVRLDRLEIPAT
jgi:hypothetical protein